VLLIVVRIDIFSDYKIDKSKWLWISLFDFITDSTFYCWF